MQPVASVLAASAFEPETVTYEHDSDEVPPFHDDKVLKKEDGSLVKRPIINSFGEFSDKVIEHHVLTGFMGSGKTRETTAHVQATAKDGVNLVLVPRRKLAVNQQRSYSAAYGRLVHQGKLPSL
eukprot:907385-Prymnesium_polylepis.1